MKGTVLQTDQLWQITICIRIFNHLISSCNHRCGSQRCYDGSIKYELVKNISHQYSGSHSGTIACLRLWCKICLCVLQAQRLAFPNATFHICEWLSCTSHKIIYASSVNNSAWKILLIQAYAWSRHISWMLISVSINHTPRYFNNADHCEHRS